MGKYDFVECSISKENIGSHDADNTFLLEPLNRQIDVWQEAHPDCTLVGVCYEEPHPEIKGYFPMVFEDIDGNRFYTHWCVGTYKEYKDSGLLVD